MSLLQNIFLCRSGDVRLLSELFHGTGQLGEAVVVVLRFIDFDSCPSTTPYKDYVW